MTCHRICCRNNTTGAGSEAGTAYRSEATRSPRFLVGFVLLKFEFSVKFFANFAFFLLVIVLSVLL
jgi:hypothetical protein